SITFSTGIASFIFSSVQYSSDVKIELNCWVESDTMSDSSADTDIEESNTKNNANKIDNKYLGLIKSPSQRIRSEEHTSELQSRFDLVCRLLLEKQNN